MTIKWVKVDPLVMNGEPFCYATRLSVRNVLEMRSNGLTPAAILASNPELRRVGHRRGLQVRVREPRRDTSAFFERPTGRLCGARASSCSPERDADACPSTALA